MWASEQGVTIDEVVTEVGSGLNAKRPRLARLLADREVAQIVVEHRDRLARFGVEHLAAALSAQGRHILVVEEGEVDDDLVRDMTRCWPRSAPASTASAGRETGRCGR